MATIFESITDAPYWDFVMMSCPEIHGTAANEQRASDLCGEADQTSRVLLCL